MALKTYTATVQTKVTGSACTAEFVVDDSELDGLNEDEKDEYLHEKALDAVFGMDQVEVYYDEGGEDE